MKILLSSWVKAWVEEKRVKHLSKSGRPPELNKTLEKKLCGVVEEDAPSEWGFQVASWDCRELVKLLSAWGVCLSTERVRQLLRGNGFRFVKTKYNFLPKNDLRRQEFITGFLEETPLLGLDNVFFADECAYKLHPKQGGKWTRCENAVIDTNCSHARVTTAGAVCPQTGKVIAVHADRNNVSTFLELLQKILDATTSITHVILDNYMVHKAKAVREFIAANGRLVLHYLPSYSPDLNVIEWLWGFVRRKYSNNRLFTTKDELKQYLTNVFNTLDPGQIKQTCTLNILTRKR